MKKEEKTNVMRVLEQKKVPYESHSYTPDATLTGEEIAGILGEDPNHVFKTLVTRGKTGQYYVFVVPVAEDLDLKKAAKASGEKSIEMIKQKELLPLTGYVHGGCSPIGMKKTFATFIHDSAAANVCQCRQGRLPGGTVAAGSGENRRVRFCGPGLNTLVRRKLREERFRPFLFLYNEWLCNTTKTIFSDV